MRRRPRVPLKWHLVLLAAGALVPTLVFAAGLLAKLYRDERAAAQARLVERAQDLAAALDREFLSVVATLDALATSERLDAGAVAPFVAEARRVLATQPTWLNVILFDARGQDLGRAVPRPGSGPVDARSFSEIRASGRPVVGDMAYGPLGVAAFAVRVPVRRDDTLRYVLTAVVRPDPLAEVVGRRHAPGGVWTLAFVDRAGRVAAGAGRAAALVGQPVPRDLLPRLKAASQGIVRDRQPAGTPGYLAFSAAPFSGWTALVGVPAIRLEAPIRRSLLYLCVGGILAVALGCAAAVLFGRRIAASLRSAATVAQALAQGQPLAVRTSSVDEVASLGEALEEAGSRLRRQDEERDVLLRRAEAAVRLRDDFIARASHELRTPLTVLKGHLALLARRDLASDPLAGELVGTARRQADRMADLVADLLDVARLEAGHARLDAGPVELAPVVRAALAGVRPLADSKRLALLEGVPDALLVAGDSLNLEQVLVNLLTNAIRHSRQGGRVTVDGWPAGDMVELRVRDCGEGIAREHLERIFEPFYQVGSAAGRRKAAGRGTGLGLAICRQVVELHGGRIWAESEGPSTGSTFVIALPALRDAGRAA